MTTLDRVDRAILARYAGSAFAPPVETRSRVLSHLSQMGDAPRPELRSRPVLGEGFMLDQHEDFARVIGVTVPHWLLSAINGAAALILVFLI